MCIYLENIVKYAISITRADVSKSYVKGIVLGWLATSGFLKALSASLIYLFFFSSLVTSKADEEHKSLQWKQLHPKYQTQHQT